MLRAFGLGAPCLVSFLVLLASGPSAQPVVPAGPVELKISEATGLPIIYAYHGKILNHDLKEIPVTEANLRNLLSHYLDAIARNPRSSPSAAAALRSRIHERAESKPVETRLKIEAGAKLLRELDPVERPHYQSMLRVIEAWGASAAAKPVTVAKNDPTFLAAANDLGLAPSEPVSAAAQPAGPTYIDQCREQKVPIPPDFGSPEWKLQGVLAPRYTFASSTDGATEVWAVAGTEAKGVCIALPRKDRAGDIQLLGIICQSKETGKACFWDNVDRKDPSQRITGAAAKTMKISDIQDASELVENCTNCHRGYNAFPIHPGTALDIGDRFDLQPDKRYEPISSQPLWGNPKPLIQRGEAPCGSCHEIPGLRDNNDASPKMPSSYCATILQNAARLTMPYVGSPAGWDAPKPAYEAHIKMLKTRCESQTVATK